MRFERKNAVGRPSARVYIQQKPEDRTSTKNRSFLSDYCVNIIYLGELICFSFLKIYLFLFTNALRFVIIKSEGMSEVN